VPVARHRNAVALAALQTTLPHRVPLFSSPARRCAGLAAMLAPALECESFMIDARLAELDFGAWEMRRWDDIPRSEIEAWAGDPVAYRPGGGETVLEAARRVCAFHAGLMRSPAEQVIVVCHAGVIRLLLACNAASPDSMGGRGSMGGRPDDVALRAAQAPHRIAYGEALVMDC
jgi:alpha-ribazole phosphatase